MWTLRNVFRPAALIGMVLMGIAAAGAQVSDETRQACTPDAMRLCSEFIPDTAKITSCMMARYAQISRPCRLAMARTHKPSHRGGRIHCHRHGRHCR